MLNSAKQLCNIHLFFFSLNICHFFFFFSRSTTSNTGTRFSLQVEQIKNSEKPLPHLTFCVPAYIPLYWLLLCGLRRGETLLRKKG